MDAQREHLAAAGKAIDAAPTFDAGSLEAIVRSVAEERGVKAGTLIHAIRVALTGKTVSPGLFDVMALLGRTRVHERVRTALTRSASRHS